MLKLNKNLKLNEILENIIKFAIIFFFTLVVFDKNNINYIKDIVLKFDIEQFCSDVARFMFAFKTFSFDLPVVFSFFVIVFNIICVTSSLIIFSMLVHKGFTFIFKLLNISKVIYNRNNDYIAISNIYLINETFRC